MGQDVLRVSHILWIWIMLVIQNASGQQNTTQCYGYLGCLSNGSPWNTPSRTVPPPQDPSVVDTQFYCYTRESRVRYNITKLPDINLNGCQFNASRITVLITHGFAGDGNATWLDMMKGFYLLQMDVNVIIVSWGPGSNMAYPQAASNTRIVALEIIRLLTYLKSTFGLTADQLHLIGFSLGAHVFAYTSNDFPVAARITGLDAAQPLFEDADNQVRLDKGDAKFVDLVHTSAYPFIPFLGFGYIRPAGHVDFYMNKGRNQPGCSLTSIDLPTITSTDDLASVSSQTLKQTLFCSHARSFMYFMYAVGGNCTFIGYNTTFEQIQSSSTRESYKDCTPETCNILGLKTPLYPARGVFEASTTSSPPYCGSETANPFVF